MDSCSLPSSEPAGAVERAKYKLLSPAKLPISRSPCITIPPGLSPTSFLESPILLSNVKVEPSPTTGSLFKPQLMHGSVANNYTSAAEISNSRTLDNKKCTSFEFEPHSRYNMVPGERDHHQSKQPVQTHSWRIPQSFTPSPSVTGTTVVSSSELSLSSPANVVASGPTSPVESNLDDPNQRCASGTVVQTSQSDHKAIGACDDGYNWRKYGQKLVKGSEFPRSYYKCTHPNCEVKKLFERSYDGKITEIIYKGNHDHPKPQPSRRYSANTNISSQSEKASSSAAGDDQMSQYLDPNTTTEQSPCAANDDAIDGVGSQSSRIHNEVDYNDDDDYLSKRRKMEAGGVDNDITPVVKPIREPRVVVQTVSEVDILDDGYRWRKYGQKVVRGNPNPRSYYKCTNAGCPVRKHVERASHDPKAVITTYEGKHNHDVPMARTTSHDTAGPVSLNEQSRMRSDDHDTISLDLGVGVSAVAEDISNGPHQTLPPAVIQSPPHSGGSNYKVIHSSPVLMYHGVLDASVNQYGLSKNQNEGQSIEIPSLNHAYPYPQNMGRILTGP